MCKAFAEQCGERRAMSGEPGSLRLLLPVAMLLSLSACGSAPEKADGTAATAVEAPAAAPALTTTPLAETSESSTKPPAPKTKVATADAATTGAPVVEAPIPPEAQQQFDSAVAAMSSGNLAAAEQQFSSLSSAYPTYAGPLLNLAILQARAGKLDEAEKTLLSAIERKPSAAAYNQLGIVQRRLGRFKDADASYQQAVQLDPSYALAYLNLGVLCDLYLQQPQRALEAYERYLELSSAPDAKVSGWVTELKSRLGVAQRSAQAES